MSYRDEILTCEKCGSTFIYRVEEQRLQEEMGFERESPELCPNCREETTTAGPGLRPGVVKWYRDDKHFGFITQPDGTDIFFHRSNIEGDPDNFEENTQVWYEVTATDRGPQAVNVHIRE